MCIAGAHGHASTRQAEIARTQPETAGLRTDARHLAAEAAKPQPQASHLRAQTAQRSACTDLSCAELSDRRANAGHASTGLVGNPSRGQRILVLLLRRLHRRLITLIVKASDNRRLRQLLIIGELALRNALTIAAKSVACLNGLAKQRIALHRILMVKISLCRIDYIIDVGRHEIADLVIERRRALGRILLRLTINRQCTLGDTNALTDGS